MTHSERIRKLANAIKLFRGKTKTPFGAIKKVWDRPPQPSQKSNIENHLIVLGIKPEEISTYIQQIESLRTYDEFDAWIKKLDEKLNENNKTGH